MISCIQFFVCGTPSTVPMLLFGNPETAWLSRHGNRFSMRKSFRRESCRRRGPHTPDSEPERHDPASLIPSLESLIALLAGVPLPGQMPSLKLRSQVALPVQLPERLSSPLRMSRIRSAAARIFGATGKGLSVPKASASKSGTGSGLE